VNRSPIEKFTDRFDGVTLLGTNNFNTDVCNPNYRKVMKADQSQLTRKPAANIEL